MPGLKERAKTLVELLDSAAYLYARRPLGLDDKAAQLVANGGRERIAGVIPRLASLADWTAQTTEEAVRGFAEASGLKLGQVAQPLRAALTGRATSPPLARREPRSPARPGGSRHRLGGTAPSFRRA
jgi:glutamyl-tRNA synthetase